MAWIMVILRIQTSVFTAYHRMQGTGNSQSFATRQNKRRGLYLAFFPKFVRFPKLVFAAHVQTGIRRATIQVQPSRRRRLSDDSGGPGGGPRPSDHVVGAEWRGADERRRIGR